MQKHTKIYFVYFDIDYDTSTGYHDYIDCEVCKGQAVDIHHIIFKSQGGKDEINNLIALCRSCHNMAHSRTLSGEHLQEIHNKHVLQHTKLIDNANH